jgi:fibronectin-binding autotransporter adhesin
LAAGTINGPATAQGFLTMNFGSASGAIALSGGFLNLNTTTGSTITVNNASDSISTVLQGTGKLTKAGTGTLTLSGANTYTGTTNISAGTLQMSGAGTIATSSSVLIGGGAIFDLNGTNQTIKLGASAGTIANNSGSGTSSLTFDGSANLGSPLIVDSTANPGGKVAVVVTANSQTFNVANTYSGGTTVNAGAFLIVGATGTQAGTGAINLTAANSGLLTAVNQTTANDITGAGYVSIIQNANGALTLTGNLTNTGIYTFRVAGHVYNFAGNGTSTLSGIIGAIGGTLGNTSGGSIIKSGTGTLTLSGASIYTGTTTVQNGTLFIGAAAPSGSAGALGNATSAIIFGNATSISTNLSPSLLINGAFTVGRNITVGANNTATTGVYTIGGSSANTSTFSGSQTLNLSLAVTQVAGGTLNLTGNITSGASGTQTLNFNNAGSVSQSTGVIGGGTGTIAVTKSGAGSTILSGVNTYSGATTVTGGSLALNGSSIKDTNKLVINGGTVDLTDAETVGTLFFGAAQQAAGTYSATGAGGTMASANFTGSGTLIVTTGPVITSPYGTWATSKGLTGANNGTNADPDFDGVSNLVEFVLGGQPNPANPGSNSTDLLPVASTPGTDLVFTFTRDAQSKVAQLALTIEVGTDLLTFPAIYTVGNDTASSTAGVTVTPSGGNDIVTLTLARSPDTKKFARLNAVYTTP